MLRQREERAAFAVPRFLAVGAVVLALGAGAVTTPEAVGAVPVGEPVFSDPLTIENEHYPIVPGAVHVYLGREDGERVTIVMTHLRETRTFEWRGQFVECRAVQEHLFVDGDLKVEETGWFAESDDGDVWGFGETEEGDDDDGDDEDEDEDEPGGWVVGNPAPTDPIDTVSVNDPALFMPANPEIGDRWFPEDFGNGPTEAFEVRGISKRVRVSGARYKNVLRIRETSPGEPGGETVWFAKGVGLVKVSSRNVRLRLHATSFQRPRRSRR